MDSEALIFWHFWQFFNFLFILDLAGGLLAIHLILSMCKQGQLQRDSLLGNFQNRDANGLNLDKSRFHPQIQLFLCHPWDLVTLSNTCHWEMVNVSNTLHWEMVTVSNPVILLTFIYENFSTSITRNFYEWLCFNDMNWTW